MRYEFKLYDENGDEHDHSLPGKMEVCPRCDGAGTHLTPSIEEHAYTGEEFMEAFSEPEDREHERTCAECTRLIAQFNEDDDREQEERPWEYDGEG